ncbi:hypothetical protein BGZ81_009210 [Podila clonocystis]|nr:hypothetical protein BGZ81_009210 [Podila clonocystis]
MPIFQKVKQTLETIPPNDNLETASELFSDLVDVTLTARNCVQAKPKDPSVVQEESSSKEKEEEGESSLQYVTRLERFLE